MKFYNLDSLDAVTEYITKVQSADESLWKSFIRQYKEKTDTPHNGGYRGEYWGKTMRGAVLVYKYTQDEKLYKVLENTVKEMLAVQEEDGRISTYGREKELCNWDMWCRKYVSVGLEYFLEICKDGELKSKIITALMRHSDYIAARVGSEQGKTPVTQTSSWWGGLNSCSILKSFVVLYELTGEARYLDFAKYIVSTGFTRDFNVIKAVLENKLHPAEFKYRKVYEMTSCFEGLLELYKVTKEQDYLRAAENFIELVEGFETTVIGGVGCDTECFNNSVTAQLGRPANVMQETCVTVSLMIYYNELYKLTGKTAYLRRMDYAYRNAYLGAINNLQGSRHHGFPFDSYAGLISARRAYKVIGGCLNIEKDRKYGCCVAIAAAGVGVYAEAGVEVKDEEVFINFYSSRKATVNVGGKCVRLTLDAPSDCYGKAVVRLDMQEKMPLKFAFLKPKTDVGILRISAGDAKVNALGEYIRISGEFEPQAEIVLEFDIPYTIETLPVSEKYSYGWFCIRRGSTVFAVDRRCVADTPMLFFNPQDVKLRAVKAPAFALQALQADYGGRKITFIDYASAGKTWTKESRYGVLVPYTSQRGISRLLCLAMSKWK